MRRKVICKEIEKLSFAPFIIRSSRGIARVDFITLTVNMKCPNCETEIYNRAQKHCRTCGHELPAALLLSEAEIRRFEQTQEAHRRANCAVDVASPNIPPLPLDGVI
jgi:predicted RNA-binding Zn-ribbon protein involved in translation (DUF1610 family)